MTRFVSTLTTSERFWSKVVKAPGCWLWSAGINSNGYGSFRLRGQMRLAPRVAWELTNGPIGNGLYVLHKCDVPRCVNPNHLFLGTNADNMADRNNKGRQFRPRGALNPKARLTAAKVREIRKRYAAGETNQSALGREYGVNASTIRVIVRKMNWLSAFDAECEARR